MANETKKKAKAGPAVHLSRGSVALCGRASKSQRAIDAITCVDCIAVLSARIDDVAADLRALNAEASPMAPDPLLSLRHQADFVEENGQPSMADKIRETVDLAEVRLNELRTAAARAEGRERFAMEVLSEIRNWLDGDRGASRRREPILLPSAIEARVVAFLDGRVPAAIEGK